MIWLIPLYSIPILRLFFFIVSIKLRPVARILGVIEIIILPIRDFFFTPFLLIRGIMAIKTDEEMLILGLSCLFLSILNWIIKIKQRLSLIDFVSLHPLISHREMLDLLICSNSPFSKFMPASPKVTSPSTQLDYKSKSHPLMGIRMLVGIWSTISISRLIMLCSRLRDYEKTQMVAGSLALFWSKYLLELCAANIEISGSENLYAGNSRTIYILNHKSFLDFILIPLVLASNPNVPITWYLPKFLIAKNHFKDNFFYYRILGIGRLAEKLGMIFVRRNENKEDAMRSVSLAAESMKLTSSPLAIFPQGTRAMPHIGANKERMDSGYYSVGGKKRMLELGKHLKKGTAYLIEKLSPPPNVIPIFIDNSATVCPKGKMKIQPNVDLKISIGKAIDFSKAGVNEILTKMDDALKVCGDVNNRLEIRFLLEAQKQLTIEKYEGILDNMKKFRPMPSFYPAIDLIFTLPPKKQLQQISKLVKLLKSIPTSQELEELRKGIISS